MRDIDTISKDNENQVIEWKESWQDKYLEWICGYANAQGGTLFIGIDDNGEVLGLDAKAVKKLMEDIPNKITAAFISIPKAYFVILRINLPDYNTFSFATMTI